MCPPLGGRSVRRMADTSVASQRRDAPLSREELGRLDGWWRAANYLSVGQIYLLDNPLLREPLTLEHVKPRLLGHWGTTPGLNLLYAHMNRAIVAARPGRDVHHRSRARRPGAGRLDVAGGQLHRGLPRHHARRGGHAQAVPAVLVSRAGSRATSRPRRPDRSTRAASSATRSCTPTARRSTTPTCWSAAWSATARPRPGRWPRAGTRTSSLNPARDGAVLPVLHLNGYKIANPTVLARIPEDELRSLLEGYGHTPRFVTGDDPETVHQALAAALDASLDEIAEIQRRARTGGRGRAPALADDRAAHAEGLDRPEGGRRPAGGGQLALAPGAARQARRKPGAPAPARGVDALLPPRGAVRRARPPARRGARAGAGGRAPHGRQSAHERRPAAAQPAASRLPRLRRRRPCAGARVERGDARARGLSARRHADERGPIELPCLRPGRDGVEPPGGGAGGHGPRLDGRDRARRRSPGPRRPGARGPQRASLPGLARGLPADRPARRLQLLRGVHPHHRLDVQPARQVAEGHARHPVATPDRVPELPAVLARLAPGPQRLLPPGPRVHRPRGQQEGRDHPRLPAAGRQLPAVRRLPLPAQP